MILWLEIKTATEKLCVCDSTCRTRAFCSFFFFSVQFLGLSLSNTHSPLKRLWNSNTHTQHSQTFPQHNSSSVSGRKSMEENIRSLVCVGIAQWPLFQGVFFFPKTVYHMFPSNSSLSSQFKKTLISQWKRFHSFRGRPSSSLSSSFHPCSAYPLSSNLVLLCRWWAGAIIGSLRLTPEQNVRRFKAACQSAFCTDSPPELPRLFITHIANWGAQRQRQGKSAPLINGLPLLLLFTALNYVTATAQYMNAAIRGCPLLWLRVSVMHRMQHKYP